MGEGIVLPMVARGTLLALPERVARLEAAVPQILAAVEGEANDVTVEATLACLLWETFAQATWCGFYRTIAPGLLGVGPYQGGMGCLRIPFARGVCGAAARTGATQLVPDVHAFADHIACDDATRSELVVPVASGGQVRAVLDLDAQVPAAFSQDEARIVEELLARAFVSVTFQDPRAE